jgi:hypothetical protein
LFDACFALRPRSASASPRAFRDRTALRDAYARGRRPQRLSAAAVMRDCFGRHRESHVWGNVSTYTIRAALMLVVRHVRRLDRFGVGLFVVSGGAPPAR